MQPDNYHLFPFRVRKKFFFFRAFCLKNALLTSKIALKCIFLNSAFVFTQSWKIDFLKDTKHLKKLIKGFWRKPSCFFQLWAQIWLSIHEKEKFFIFFKNVFLIYQVSQVQVVGILFRIYFHILVSWV